MDGTVVELHLDGVVVIVVEATYDSHAVPHHEPRGETDRGRARLERILNFGIVLGNNLRTNIHFQIFVLQTDLFLSYLLWRNGHLDG